MNFKGGGDIMAYMDMGQLFGLGAFMAAIAGILAILAVIVIVVYVYMAIAWMTIFRKIEYKYPWIAWIPVANIAGMLQAGGFHWAWVFLIVVPILGWIPLFILVIIATWRIYEKRKYPGWLALIPVAAIIPFINFLVGPANLIITGVVAWVDR